MNHVHFPFTLLSVPKITPLHLQLMKHILQQILPILRIASMKSRRMLQRPPSQFLHNAFLREIDLSWSFAHPLLKEASAIDDLQQVSDELINLWEEPKRFTVLVSNVESLVCSSAFSKSVSPVQPSRTFNAPSLDRLPLSFCLQIKQQLSITEWPG